MRPKVLVLFNMKSEPLELLKQYCDVDILVYPEREKVLEIIGEYDGLIVSPLNKVGKEIIEKGEKLKVISTQSAGYDHIDVEAATKRGIYVTKVSGVLSEAVAEFTVGLTIALLRKIAYSDKFIRRGLWDSQKTVWGWYNNIETVYGKKVGDIEKEVNAKWLPLEDVLKQSDIVILALPSTPETYHIINEERLKLMEGKYLINIGRGSLVDEKALIKALKEGKLKGYATDVYEKEPLQESELFEMEWETVLTPHHAGLAREAMIDMGFQAVNNLLSIFKGEVPENLVNREVLKVRPIEEVKLL
ncbi:MAG: glyoxylate reductase [Thermococcaceae archaeon]|nr:glyoxylate reductase [Thermococcaceae archaeon]